MSAAAAAATIPSPPESVEGGEPVEETTTDAEVPAEGETPPVETDTPPEGEEPAAAAPVEIPEEQLKTAAEKYAADAIKRANTTMAAARRAEARTEVVKQENAALKQANEKQLGDLRYAADFIGRLQKGDPSALAEIGFKTVREFLDAVANHGEAKPDTAETRLERLERERKEEREAQAKAQHEAAVREAQSQVFGLVDGDKKRWRFTATARGHEEFWESLGAYHQLHGSVPEDMVPVIADAVEAELRKEFGSFNAAPASSAPRPGANNGASPAATGRTPKTITAKGAAAAPGASEYSLDPDERDRQVNARLRADGII